jgi:hypothetical protein
MRYRQDLDGLRAIAVFSAILYLADSLGITVLRSYNPRSVNCEKNEFFDGLHPKESCVSKILLNNL